MTKVNFHFDIEMAHNCQTSGDTNATIPNRTRSHRANRSQVTAEMRCDLGEGKLKLPGLNDLFGRATETADATNSDPSFISIFISGLNALGE